MIKAKPSEVKLIKIEDLKLKRAEINARHGGKIRVGLNGCIYLNDTEHLTFGICENCYEEHRELMNNHLFKVVDTYSRCCDSCGEDVSSGWLIYTIEFSFQSLKEVLLKYVLNDCEMHIELNKNHPRQP